MTYSRKRIRSKRSKISSENALQYCDVYIFYYNFLNECVVVKDFCRYFVIYHNWKVLGENFLQQASPNCRFQLYVEHLNLCKVNNTTFCLFWFIHQLWTAKNNSFFILHQFDTANNTVLSLIYFFSPPLCRLKTQFNFYLLIFSNVMEKFDCTLKCPFFLHIDFSMVRNNQKLHQFTKNETLKIMTHS